MSIYSHDLEEENLKSVYVSNNEVYVIFSKVTGLDSHNGIRIKTPSEAQNFRSKVNEAVDLFMKNYKPE